MIFYIYHTHFEFRAYINFECHSYKDNRDIARNVAAFWVIQAIEPKPAFLSWLFVKNAIYVPHSESRSVLLWLITEMTRTLEADGFKNRSIPILYQIFNYFRNLAIIILGVLFIELWKDLLLFLMWCCFLKFLYWQFIES